MHDISMWQAKWVYESHLKLKYSITITLQFIGSIWRLDLLLNHYICILHWP